MLIFQGVGLNQQPPSQLRNIINYWCAPESSSWKGWGVGQVAVTPLVATPLSSRRWLLRWLVETTWVVGKFSSKLWGVSVPEKNQPGFFGAIFSYYSKKPNTFAFYNAIEKFKGWKVSRFFFESLVFRCSPPGSFIDCTTRDVPIHFRAQGAQSASA